MLAYIILPRLGDLYRVLYECGLILALLCLLRLASWQGNVNDQIGSVGAAILLTYTLGRRNIFLTGKNADKSLWVSKSKAQAYSAISEVDYNKSSSEVLIKLLSHNLPQIRIRALNALRKKKDNYIPSIIAILGSGSDGQKIDILRYFGAGCDTAIRQNSTKKIVEILLNKKEHFLVRVSAADALSYSTGHNKQYYNVILKLVEEVSLNDPLGVSGVSLGRSLTRISGDPYADGLVKDKRLFYKAASLLMENQRQNGRAQGIKMVSKIPLKDFHFIGDKLMHIINDKDASYHSYHNPKKTIAEAIIIFANLNIKEGIQMAIDIHKMKTGKYSFKQHACWAILAKYGANAKPALKQLEQLYMTPNGPRTDFGRGNKKYRAMLKAVNSTNAPKELISYKEALAFGKQ